MMMFFGFLPLLFLAVAFGVINIIRRTAGERHFRRGPAPVNIGMPAHLDGDVFRLARRRGGRLTLSDVVVETGMDLAEAERYMDSLVDNAHVLVEVDDNGRLSYEFPELHNDAGDTHE